MDEKLLQLWDGTFDTKSYSGGNSNQGGAMIGEVAANYQNHMSGAHLSISMHRSQNLRTYNYKSPGGTSHNTVVTR